MRMGIGKMGQEMLENMELQPEIMWESDKTKKLGHMRADFDNGQSKVALNRWFPADDINEKVKEYGIDLHEVQDAINWVIFEKVNTLDKVIEICDGKTGHFDDKSYFFQYGKCNYWVRFIPAEDDYNIYVNVYHQ